MSRVGSVDDAEDIVQQTFTESAEGVASFRGDSTLRSWLITLTDNHCFEHYRRRSRERKIFAGSPEGLEEVCESGADEDKIVLRITLERLLRRLPAVEQQILRLRFQEDLKYEEIAERLDMPLGTVAWRISEALRRLGSMLEDKEN